jgi:hypothetical protein
MQQEDAVTAQPTHKPTPDMLGGGGETDCPGRLRQEQGLPSASGSPAPVSPEQMRGKILELEAAMLAMPEHQVELRVTHHFAPGVYMRELLIPKGVMLTGKIHKTEHMNILSQGDITVWTEDGMKRLTASTVIKSQPGIKRVGYAHEDSIWITVHPTDETDVAKIEDQVIAKSFDEFLEFSEKKKLEGGT